jgi:hypothetical protein
MKSRVVGATKFKAKRLIIEQMTEDDDAIITKRGRPVPVLGLARKELWKSPKGMWANKVRVRGDMVNIDTSDLWDVLRKQN